MKPGGTLDDAAACRSRWSRPCTAARSRKTGRIVYLGVATGYVIRFEDGLTIYFAGDTSICSATCA